MKNELIWERLEGHLPPEMRQYVLDLFSDCFDFSIPKYWRHIIADLVMMCYWRTNNYNKLIKIVQVKQKFGALRLYIDGNDDEFIYGAIQMAELQCARICAHCGSYGVDKEGLKFVSGVRRTRWNRKCEVCKDR